MREQRERGAKRVVKRQSKRRNGDVCGRARTLKQSEMVVGMRSRETRMEKRGEKGKKKADELRCEEKGKYRGFR